jgi:prepilin-type N-terminal cleavage/methylation domain-containing protein
MRRRNVSIVDGHSSPLFRSGGFTLVELLVVMAILGGVMASVFSLYNVQRKTTNIEVDVVEVQQNLRIGMESITGDLRMTGFTIAGPVDPINAASDDTGLNSTDSITLNTPSAEGSYARVDAPLTTNLITSTPVVLTVTAPEEVDGFTIGDIARVVNPAERAQVVNIPFTVTALDRSVPSVTVTPGANATDVLFERGSIVAKTGSSAPDAFPNLVEYCVGPSAGCGTGVTACGAGQCLMRVRNGVATNDDVVAENIENFQVRYITDGGIVEADSVAALSTVRAVRVTLSGKNYSTEGLSGAPKTRELTTVVKLRNR